MQLKSCPSSLLQPETPGCGVHEATQQGGEHRARHRQGRHAHPGGEGLLQTGGERRSLSGGQVFVDMRGSSDDEEEEELSSKEQKTSCVAAGFRIPLKLAVGL